MPIIARIATKTTPSRQRYEMLLAELGSLSSDRIRVAAHAILRSHGDRMQYDAEVLGLMSTQLVEHTAKVILREELLGRATRRSEPPPAAGAELTVEQIRKLRSEAASAGDERQVRICDRALDGDDAAIGACMRVVR